LISQFKTLHLGAAATLAGMLLTLGCSSTHSEPNPVPVPAAAAVAPSNSAWSFGVMADTQWTVADDGQNPNSVAVGIINQLNAEFIRKNVKFVVQVGDLTDNGSSVALQTTARYRQALYNAGIGFFPLRGNHESSQVAANEFIRVFPQTANGAQNNLPADVLALTTADDARTLPVAKIGSTFTIGTSFSSPAANLAGLTYAFDYNNVRVVMLDQFTPTDGAANTLDAQQAWIGTTLAGKPGGGHAFVFGHKGLITANHVDSLFGADPSQDPAGQNAFITSLAGNGVRYYVGGHDHVHNRSIVTTTTGSAAVQDIICASDSTKFYIPANPSNDTKYNVPAFGRTRETPLVQEVNTIGYYIYTVDGPKVTVDYYSAVVNPAYSSGEYLLATTPAMTFNHQETFGYSLNGKEFLVGQGASYTSVQDGIARIISGTNGFNMVDGSGRPCAHTVDTGWTTKTSGLYTDILTLWGMANNLGSGQTDTHVLTMTYNPSDISDAVATTGKVGIATKGATTWVNAVSGNYGGTPRFVAGPYKPTYGQGAYGLGSYGVDTTTHTFWAVINFNGDFAVAPSI